MCRYSYNMHNYMPSAARHEHFPLLKLPAELRFEIFRYALLPRGHMVVRENMPPMPSLRYRCHERPTLLIEKSNDSTTVLCKDYECRHHETYHEHTIESVKTKEFAFGLFRTSREVSYDAVKIFFGEIHFIFESRFDLHIFLKSHKHAQFVKSLTFNGKKSNGPHSKQVKARFTTWKLRSARYWGPTVSASIRELDERCPELDYLEMLDDRRCDSVQDHVDLETEGYARWEEVQCICSIRLRGFRYMLPDMERYTALTAKGLVLACTYFDWPLQHQNMLREATESYIRKNIAGQIT
jgi:hypothetical protein